jgi:hypothetical protein
LLDTEAQIAIDPLAGALTHVPATKVDTKDETTSELSSLCKLIKRCTPSTLAQATEKVIQQLADNGGTDNHTQTLARYNCTDFLFREGEAKSKFLRVSMLGRNVDKPGSNHRSDIPLLGQGHVLELAANRYSVVIYCVGGTRCCGNRWYAISIDAQSMRLRATPLCDLGSDAFPRRSLYFCIQGKELSAFIKAITDSEVREVLDQPQLFGGLIDTVEAHVGKAFVAPPGGAGQDSDDREFDVDKSTLPVPRRVRTTRKLTYTTPTTAKRPRSRGTKQDKGMEKDQDHLQLPFDVEVPVECTELDCDQTFPILKGMKTHVGIKHRKKSKTDVQKSPDDIEASTSLPFSPGMVHSLDYQKLADCVSSILPKPTVSRVGLSMDEHTKLTEANLDHQAKISAAHEVVLEKQRADFLKRSKEQASAAMKERQRSQELAHRANLAVIESHKHTVAAIAGTTRAVPASVTTTAPAIPRTATVILQEIDPELTVALLAANPEELDGVLMGISTLGARLVVKRAVEQELAGEA